MKGVISGGGGDEIHAVNPFSSFTVSDSLNKKVLITPGSPANFLGVFASVA